jgi:hypothetical protein
VLVDALRGVASVGGSSMVQRGSGCWCKRLEVTQCGGAVDGVGCSPAASWRAPSLVYSNPPPRSYALPYLVLSCLVLPCLALPCPALPCPAGELSLIAQVHWKGAGDDALQDRLLCPLGCTAEFVRFRPWVLPCPPTPTPTPTRTRIRTSSPGPRLPDLVSRTSAVRWNRRVSREKLPSRSLLPRRFEAPSDASHTRNTSFIAAMRA